jgi:hypothetical protein
MTQTFRSCSELLCDIRNTPLAIRGELSGFLCQPCGSYFDARILVCFGADGKSRRICGRYRVRVICNKTIMMHAHMGNLPSDKPSCCISGKYFTYGTAVGDTYSGSEMA